MNGSTHGQDDRYGAPLVTKRTARILAALAAFLFIAVVVYVGIQSTSKPITAEMVAYDHVSDDVIAVDFLLTMDPGTEASCRIQALNKGRAQVGFVEAPIAAQTARQSTHHLEISTQGEAVSAEIIGCDPV